MLVARKSVISAPFFVPTLPQSSLILILAASMHGIELPKFVFLSFKLSIKFHRFYQ